MKNIAKMIAMIAAVFCVALAVPRSVCAADDAETTRHYFTCYTSATQKIEYFVEGSDMVIVTKSQGSSYDFSKHYYETCLNRYFEFYRLNADSSGVELIYPRKYKEYTLSDGVWTVTTDYAASNYPEYRAYPSMINFYVDFSQMDCDILEVNLLDRGTAFNKGTGQMEYKTVDHDLKANLYSYLLNGTFTDYGKNYIFVSHSDAKTLVPGFAPASKNGTLQQASISITVNYDEESGVVSWNDFFTVEENTVFKGVLALFEVSPGSEQFAYRTVLTGSSYKISLGGCDFNNKDKRYSTLILRPYYINTNGSIYYGGAQTVVIDADSVAATRSASSMLTQVKISTSSGGVLPDKALGSGGSEPSDFQYDSSIPVPRLRFTGTLNFYIENASDDYFVEIQGRHYTVDDIELFKQNLLWKYKYSTVLKNDLSVWVDVQRRKLSRGNFDLLDLGSESFENLLLSYPIENRNYYGGSNALGNYLSGYSDALSQLKTVLLPVPGTLLNGTEIYIRFYTIDDQNTCHYGKWCHWYDNMGDPDGSSASQWDDKENMFTENQSESGLTDSAKDQIEESGYSKSDSDVSSSYNNTSSWDSKASDSVFSVISSIVSNLGAFPNLIAKVCSFLPDWAFILIGVGIGFVVLLRFVGR